MAFMEPDYTNEDFVIVTNAHGESYACPAGYEELQDGDTLERVSGKWWYRLSANGYMDCTDWDGPYDTEQEARDALSDAFDVDPDTGDDLDDDSDSDA